MSKDELAKSKLGRACAGVSVMLSALTTMCSCGIVWGLHRAPNSDLPASEEGSFQILGVFGSALVGPASAVLSVLLIGIAFLKGSRRWAVGALALALLSWIAIAVTYFVAS